MEGGGLYTQPVAARYVLYTDTLRERSGERSVEQEVVGCCGFVLLGRCCRSAAISYLPTGYEVRHTLNRNREVTPPVNSSCGGGATS